MTKGIDYILNGIVGSVDTVFNRPGVAGAVLQIPLSLIKSHYPFPPNLQNIFTPKPYELGTLSFERMFTSLHVSHVPSLMSRVTSHMSNVTFGLDKVVELEGGSLLSTGTSVSANTADHRQEIKALS